MILQFPEAPRAGGWVVAVRALVVLLALLCSCEAPIGAHVGNDWAPVCQAVYWCQTPERTEFYAGPGCTGDGFIAGYGGTFDYASVRAGSACIDESGVGYGFQVRP